MFRLKKEILPAMPVKVRNEWQLIAWNVNSYFNNKRFCHLLWLCVSWHHINAQFAHVVIGSEAVCYDVYSSMQMVGAIKRHCFYWKL